MTVHSGIGRPVHTGIVSSIKLFGALRFQRRLEPSSTTSLRCRAGVFHRRAAPPHRSSQGHPLLPRLASSSFLHKSCSRRVSTAGLGSTRHPLRRALCLLRFVIVYMFQGCGLGLPRGDFRPLLRLPGLAPLRFVVSYIIRGRLVDSSLRQRGSCTGSSSLEPLLNSSRLFTTPNSGVHPERKRHGSGCDPCSTPSQEGLTDTRRVSWREVFPGFLPLSWSVPFPLFFGRSSRALSTSSCRCHAGCFSRVLYPVLPGAHLACQKLGSLSWHFWMHHVTHLATQKGSFKSGEMALKLELQVRSSSERLRRGHYMSESSYERLSKMMSSTCDRLPFASGTDFGVRPTGSETRMGSETVCA